MIKNLKALLPEELEYINLKYNFEILEDKYIVVSCNDYNRKTLHNANKSFILNTSIRHITITLDAINYWKNNFKENYTLMDVQNAINELILTYQDVSIKSLNKQLLRKNSKIKII